MPLPQENISSDLLDLLKNRFTISDTVDEKGVFTDDPAETKIFSFDFVNKNGEDKGCIVISLLDDSESNNSIKIYFGQELADADSDTKTEWYKFLQNLRQFAKMHLLGFDVRNINKSKVTRRDIEKDLKLVKEDLEPMFENTFGPIDGTVKTSKQNLQDSNIRIVIKHSDRIDPNIRYGRSRRIERIYLVNGNNERFLLPFKSLVAARAMARHIETGGTPYDEVGKTICKLVDEMVSLNKFYNKNKKDLFLATDPTGAEAIASARQRYLEIKKTLSSLTSKGGYIKNSPVIQSKFDNDFDDANTFNESIFEHLNEESKLAIPYVTKAMQTYKKLMEFDDYEKWINATSGKGEGEDILLDAGGDEDEGIKMCPECPYDAKAMPKYDLCTQCFSDQYGQSPKAEAESQTEQGKEAGQKDLSFLKHQQEDAEDANTYEYGGMHGSVPTPDEITGAGGMSYGESVISKALNIVREFDDQTLKTGHEPEKCLYCNGEGCEGCEDGPPFDNAAEKRAVELGQEDWNWNLYDDQDTYDNFVTGDEEVLESEEYGHRLSESIPDREDNDLRNQWTSCEEYGHKFDNGVCVDCGEKDYGYEENTDPIVRHEREQLDGIDLNDEYKTPYYESKLNEIFGFSKLDNQAKANVELQSLRKILKFLGFEPSKIIRDDLFVYSNRYFNVVLQIVMPPNKFKIEWGIIRNNKMAAQGEGYLKFVKAMFNIDEFRDHLVTLRKTGGKIPDPIAENTNIVDDLIANYKKLVVMEADPPATMGWAGPLTWPHVYLGSKFHTRKEIAKHKNTTGKLSPFSLLNSKEKEVDEKGEKVPSMTTPRGIGPNYPTPSNQAPGLSNPSRW